MAITRQLIERKFNALPDELAAALASSDTLKKVEGIAMSASLTPEQSEIFKDIISSVLLGVIHINDLELNLKSNLVFSPEKIAAITEQCHKQLFNEFKTQLIEMGDKITAQDIEEINTKEEPIVEHAERPHSTSTTQAPAPIQQVKPVIPATPVVPATPQPSLINSRLNQVTSMPQQTISVTPPTIPSPAPVAPKPTSYTGSDPYREAPTP